MTDDERPLTKKDLTEALAAMAGWTEAEKKFCRPHFDDVAIAEDCMFDRLAIDKTQRTGLNGQ